MFERPLHKETMVLAGFKQPMSEGVLVEEGGGRRGRGSRGRGRRGGDGVLVSYMYAALMRSTQLRSNYFLKCSLTFTRTLDY